MGNIEFLLLGPIECRIAGTEVRPAGRKQRIVLSALLLSEGRAVSVDRLIDAVWEVPPPTAEKQIRNAVSSLRGQLLDKNSVVGLADAGYRIDLSEASVDVMSFTAHAIQARQHLAANRIAEAVTSFQAALSLWRGPALAGVDSPVLHPRIVGLDEQRLAIAEESMRLQLSMGRHVSLIDELSGLVAENPHRERLVSSLVLALHRCGAHSQALDLYERTRQSLADELGVEPGSTLRKTHRMVLANPCLDVIPEPGTVIEPSARLSPVTVSDFWGRRGALQQIEQVLHEVREGAPSPVVTIDGMAGVGKTALAVHAAHVFSHNLFDLRLFLDLRAHSPHRQPVDQSTALQKLLIASGLTASQVPEGLEYRRALWKARSAARRVLLILDDARDSSQVRGLLPAGSGCLTLVTSRRRLTGLDQAHIVALDPPTEEEAIQIFTQSLGDGRYLAEPAEVEQLVRRCGYLPLALRIAVARLRHRRNWTIGQLADRLTDTRILDELHTDDRSVATAIEQSYVRLTPIQRQVIRRVARLGVEQLDAAMANTVSDLPQVLTEQLLEDLVDVHLLLQDGPLRYRMHALVRAFLMQAPAEDGSP
jgi:DNA-binding SARP family transcriptional activator